MYFRVILKSYFKNFLIIFLSLLAFFVFVDFMLVKSKLPDSANLQVLYFTYRMMGASLIIYPLSLFMALLMSVFSFVRKNEMSVFFALGYSPKRLLLPIVFFAVSVIGFFISIQFFSEVSFDSKADDIKNGQYFAHNNKNLFFKFKNKTIFIEKLDILQKKAYNMRVFEFDKLNKLQKTYLLKEAVFKNDFWYSSSSVQTQIKDINISKKITSMTVLEGFNPIILNKIKTKKSMSLKTAFKTMYLLKKQNINIAFIKTYIYNTIIPPLSFLLLIIIVFLNAPINFRVSNVALYNTISLFGVVVLWGIFILVRRMSLNGILSPDIAFLTPFVALLGVSVYYFKKI